MAKRIKRASPFGRKTRGDILQEHFAQHPVQTLRAWEFIYRELLWVDSSTGLAHLYESDKVQPGRSVWYERAGRFTDRLCHEFGNITRDQLKTQIDGLFQECLGRSLQDSGVGEVRAAPGIAIAKDQEAALAPEILAQAQEVAASSPTPHVPDAELATEFAQLLRKRSNLNECDAATLATDLVSKARYYFNVGKKRQNVLGQGFEDVLQLLINELTTVPSDCIRLRCKADELPGFERRSKRDRIEAPDLAVVSKSRTKLIASFKWSLRQDRQKQLSDELDCYVDLCSQRPFPRYVLVTNEYDLGRLINTNALQRRKKRIDCIYHLHPDFLREALSDSQKFKSDIEPLVQQRRLRSVADFLQDLNAEFGVANPAQPLTPDQKRQRQRRSR